MRLAYEMGDADNVIASANDITTWIPVIPH